MTLSQHLWHLWEPLSPRLALTPEHWQHLRSSLTLWVPINAPVPTVRYLHPRYLHRLPAEPTRSKTVNRQLVLIMTTRSQRKQRKDQNRNLRNLRNRPIQHRLTLVIAILIVLTRAGPMPIWFGVLYVCFGFTFHAQVKTSDIWEHGRVKTAEIYCRL